MTDDHTPADPAAYDESAVSALLKPYGPHSDDYTTLVALVFAESVRVLNHATRSLDGLTRPQTVYTVLSYLAGGAGALGQLFGQLAAFLDREAAQGRLAHDAGTDPRAAIGQTRGHLGAAIRHAAALFDELSAAQNITSHLSVPDPHRRPGAEGGRP